MDDSKFLSSYKKKLAEEQNLQGSDPAASAPETAPEPLSAGSAPPASVAAGVPEAPEAPTPPVILRYEDKSSFVRPSKVSDPRFMPNQTKSKAVPIAVTAVVIIALVLLLVWYFNRGVKVVDLVGWTLSDAQIWAGDNKIKLQIEEAYNDEYKADQIVSQNQAAGSSIKRGGFLKITVSLGHDLTVTLPIPDFMNMAMSEIEAWAQKNFMTKVYITTEYNDQISAGRVISFEINDNTVVDKVKRNTPIYIVVSKGPPKIIAVEVTIPDFTTLSLTQSQQFADENDLTLVIVEQYSDYAPSGTILSQSPAAESKAEAGDEVTLTVSKGRKILIPDFSAYSQQRAATAAAELGLSITQTEKYSGRSAGKFLSQSLAAGSIYTAGDVLELVYSLGNQIVLPSFVGQTRDAIDAWALELNSKGAALVVKTTSTQNSAAKNTIIYQNPAGKTVGISATIQITVSLGRTVFVPDLVAPEGSGYDLAITRDKAMEICAQLNIIPVFVSESKTGRLPGEIWYQSAAPGEEIYENSTLTLKYNPANVTLDIPDFTGMTPEEILAAGYSQKLDIQFIQADIPVEGYVGKVVGQTIIPGTTVVYGTAITLTVAPGSPAETTETSGG
ncbi:MAG TPA: hypothetical protein DD640_00175 [Clostridiales bacterium]|nr:hypothetical protein [Clostridiales bacterium]